MSEAQEVKQPNRKLRDGESLCTYNCGTIIRTDDKADGAQGHCGMCCPAAIDARTKRVAPIHKAAEEKAEKEGKERAARHAKEAK